MRTQPLGQNRGQRAQINPAQDFPINVVAGRRDKLSASASAETNLMPLALAQTLSVTDDLAQVFATEQQPQGNYGQNGPERVLTPVPDPRIGGRGARDFWFTTIAGRSRQREIALSAVGGRGVNCKASETRNKRWSYVDHSQDRLARVRGALGVRDSIVSSDYCRTNSAAIEGVS